MAFIPTPSMALATITFTGPGGAQAQNRLYCSASTPPVEDDLTEIAATLMTWLNSQWSAIASNKWEVTALRVRAVNEAEGIFFEQSDDLPVVGGESDATPMSNAVTASVTLNTGLVGRAARGRIYHVGLIEGQQNGFRLTDGSRDDIQNVYNNLLTDLDGAGHALQVVSFVDDHTPRTEGRALPVLAAQVRFPLATQRRRLT